MNQTQKLEQAWIWARNTRLEALHEKQTHLTLLDSPFDDGHSQEVALMQAEKTIQSLDVILSEIEKAHIRALRQNSSRNAARLGLLVAGALFSFGAASLATLGVAAVCIVICAPDPAVQAAAVVGTALSLAWAVKFAHK
jgi:hypothetical protein